jgi:hypothetical protein
MVSTVVASTLAISSALVAAAPAAASCIPLADLLPDPSSPSAVVLVGTVLTVEQVHTELLVDSWYLGESPSERVIVAGGREPGAITSVDWVPAPGQQFVVVAEPAGDGSLITASCQQSEPFPDLLGALEARYGDAQLPPFPPASDAIGSPAPSPLSTTGSPEPGTAVSSPPVVTSNDSPLPGSLVHGTPQP